MVGLVDEVSPNRTVMLLVLNVVGLNALTVVLCSPVVHIVVPVEVVGRASVTLTVDSGSTISGLTPGGTVEVVGGFNVLDSSGVAEGMMGSGRMGSSGAGGAIVELVCGITEVIGVVTLNVGLVCGGVEDVVVKVVAVMGMEEAAVLVVTAEVTPVAGDVGSTAAGTLIPEISRDTFHEKDWNNEERFL